MEARARFRWWLRSIWLCFVLDHSPEWTCTGGNGTTLDLTRRGYLFPDGVQPTLLDRPHHPCAQPVAMPDRFENLEFEHFFLQPMDGPDRARNTELVVAYCLQNPRWRVSLQTHKLMGIP
jgi:hypothetical protein